MLIELSIRNFAIIESARLQFGPGFTVLTGETGAGKSIIVDAVALLLGGRASTEVIRTGCDMASIEGIFVPSEETRRALEPLLRDLGLEHDGEELIIRREVSRQRRNVCRVNGYAVTLNALEEIGAHLVDIHGQGAHLSLLQPRNHIDFLDRFGGLWSQRQAFAERVQALRQVRADLRALRRDERETARRIDLLSYQIDEIRTAKLKPDEEEELRRQETLLGNAERRMELAAQIYALLFEGEGRRPSVLDNLSTAAESLRELAQLDDTLSETSQRLEEALYNIEDLARTVRRYRDSVEYDPEALAAIEERLDLIRSLKRKYGDSISEILAFAARAEAELDGITHSEERMEQLQREQARLLQEMAILGRELSAARHKAGERLRAAIEPELRELNMEGARFEIDIHWEEAEDGVPAKEGLTFAFDDTGLDRVEFLIAPNPGEDPKPLARIASGGETSRLMLAMKTALSTVDPVPTLIFDEIDAGIGGRTGRIVGAKLRRLAEEHQVFCVTHLAQIASLSTQHFRVTKEVVEGRTVSLIRPLTYEERIEELAVMLGGAATEATRESAAELLAP
ncbi:MAG: DNA repair protein RecN [Chloroflexi bacterium]|nr:DNA repair protein RecN [Chloroflexota bacterium]